MIREFANLFEVTVRELRLAGRRIGRQSNLVLAARLRLRRWYRRLRQCRRRLRRQSNRRPAGKQEGQFCDWQVHESKYGRLYWSCRYCECKTLRPTTKREQARAGARCGRAREGNHVAN